MTLPKITAAQLGAAFPQLENVGTPRPGGQKLVFPCKLAGVKYAVKVLRCQQFDAAHTTSETMPLDVDYARAKREVAILQACNSHYLPKIGPLELTEFPHDGDRLLAFSEEFIEGPNLEELLARSGPLTEPEAIRLASNIVTAIAELWRLNKIHRDIKPANIMRRNLDGSYVLLDPGIAFDLVDGTLTAEGCIPHSPGYIAPEHTNPARKREADVRADLFLLGISLYEAVTGTHPFRERVNQSPVEIIQNILRKTPITPRARRREVSVGFSQLVMRLLEKKRHMRFRSCDHLQEALLKIEGASS